MTYEADEFSSKICIHLLHALMHGTVATSIDFHGWLKLDNLVISGFLVKGYPGFIVFGKQCGGTKTMHSSDSMRIVETFVLDRHAELPRSHQHRI